MKKNYFFFAILSIPLVFSLFAIVSYVSEVRLDGIWLDKTSSPSTAWGVKGRVRNLENHPIKGYVKIKFLNTQGDIIASHSAYVNDGDPIDPGQAAPFEYWAPPNEFTGVINFQVIFRDR